MTKMKGEDQEKTMTRTTRERYSERCIAIIDLPLARRRWMTLLNVGGETLPLPLFLFCFSFALRSAPTFFSFYSLQFLFPTNSFHLPLSENNIKAEFSHSKKLLSSFTNFYLFTWNLFKDLGKAFNLIAKEKNWKWIQVLENMFSNRQMYLFSVQNLKIQINLSVFRISTSGSKTYFLRFKFMKLTPI